MKFSTIFILIISTQIGIDAAKPCAKKYFKEDSFVCVCNKTYCDTIEEFDDEDIAEGSYVWYESNMAEKRMYFSKGNFKHEEDHIGFFRKIFKDFFTSSFTVDPTTKYQEIFGFGGSLTDSTLFLLDNLSIPVQEALLRNHFSEEGLNYTFIRLSVGSSDYGTHKYTYDDAAVDEKTSHFNLTMEDYKYKIPYIKRIMNMSRAEIRLMATSWIAPQWMVEPRYKNNPSLFRLKESHYQHYADYFIKFFDIYKQHGIHFWGITPQNEPVNGWYGGLIPLNLGWTADEQANWVGENLGPSLHSNGYGYIKVIVYDDQRYMLTYWASVHMKHPTARKYVAGLSVHAYTNWFLPPNLVAKAHNAFPNLFILETEISILHYFVSRQVYLGKWTHLDTYAVDIFDNLNNWASGWVDWNLCVDLEGGPSFTNNSVDAPATVDVSNDLFYKGCTWYAIAHFSHFVPSGSRRIGLKTWRTSGVKSSAFLTPQNRVVVVLLNMHDNPVDVVIKTEKQGNIVLKLSTRSINTIVYKAVT